MPADRRTRGVVGGETFASVAAGKIAEGLLGGIVAALGLTLATQEGRVGAAETFEASVFQARRVLAEGIEELAIWMKAPE